MQKLFFGGVHPADKKELTKTKKLISLKSTKQVIIPLKQHIGVSCKPLVKPGDQVAIGQKIGDNEGLCVPVHASVSGKVTAVEPRLHPGGSEVLSIVIENDFKESLYDKIAPHPAPERLSFEDLVWMIREAGLVGMGGATFPTEKKAISSQNKVDTLLINGCECEPYITADDVLMMSEPERVLGGIRLLGQALKPEKIILAMEDNKKEAANILKKYLEKYPEITLKILPTRYPQGAEKQLIKAVTGREVPPGKLPADVACTVFNVSTAAAVYQAVYEGMPLVRRIVTVTGEGVKEPQNMLVPIGTPFSVLVEAAGGLTEEADKVIAGGPMMGKAQESLDVPVVKGTGAILCLTKEKEVKHTACIRCGKCLAVCPVNLQPLYLYRYGKTKNLAMLEQYHLMDCMECGCCAYTCPAKLPLVEAFRNGKNALKEGK